MSDKNLERPKEQHCVICTSTKDLQPYLGTKIRCKICEKEGRHQGTVKK